MNVAVTENRSDISNAGDELDPTTVWGLPLSQEEIKQIPTSHHTAINCRWTEHGGMKSKTFGWKSGQTPSCVEKGSSDKARTSAHQKRLWSSTTLKLTTSDHQDPPGKKEEKSCRGQKIFATYKLTKNQNSYHVKINNSWKSESTNQKKNGQKAGTFYRRGKTEDIRKYTEMLNSKSNQRNEREDSSKNIHQSNKNKKSAAWRTGKEVRRTEGTLTRCRGEMHW